MTLDGMWWIVILPAVSKLFYNGKDESGNLFNSWSYTKINYILFVSGILMIILGYIIMVTGETNSFQSLSLSPVILLIGYLILIPASLLYKEKE